MFLVCLCVLPRAVCVTDLHSHTSNSDGTDSPHSLIVAAANAGVTTLAITDHDQLTVIDDTNRAAAEELNVTIVYATEISVEWRVSVGAVKAHLLGYFTHTNASPTSRLSALLTDLRRSRHKRNVLILEKLQRAGLKVTAAEVLTAAGRSVDDDLDFVGRPHIAAVLLHQKAVASMKEAFNTHLSDERLALAEWALDIKDAVRAVDESGGVAVLAHPITTGMTIDVLRDELRALLSAHVPLSGIECFSSRHTAEQSAAYVQLANELGLLVTGGSDYHGNNKANVPIGQFGGGHNTWTQMSDRAVQQLEKRHEAVAVKHEFAGIMSNIVTHCISYGLLAATILLLTRLYHTDETLPGPLVSAQSVLRSTALMNFLCLPIKSLSTSQVPSHTAVTPAPLPMNIITPLGHTRQLVGGVGDSPQVITGRSLINMQQSGLHSASNVQTSLPQIVARGRHTESGQSATAVVIVSDLLSRVSIFRGGFVHFAYCFIGLQLSYLSWGLLQERIMTVRYGSPPEHFVYSEFLVLINRTSAVVIALVVSLLHVSLRRMVQLRSNDVADETHQSLLNEESVGAPVDGADTTMDARDDLVWIRWRIAPPYKYSLCSISNVLSSWFQYEALHFVSFPLQVLSKSSKVLFAMLMGAILNRTTYRLSEYVNALMIAAGLIFYRLSESTAHDGIHGGSGADSPGEYGEWISFIVGATLLVGYIIADSFTSQWQSALFKQYKMDEIDMMFAVNAFSATISAVSIIAYGQSGAAMAFLSRHHDCLFHCIVMSVLSAVGQLFIFHTISNFGAVAFSSLMTARQLLSLVLSISVFHHGISHVGIAGLSLVFTALTLQIVEDVNRKHSTHNANQTAAAARRDNETTSVNVANSNDKMEFDNATALYKHKL